MATIIEAIKSGKPFRRKYEDEYGWRNANEIFKEHEIVADDWEIQSEKPRVFLWEIRYNGTKHWTLSDIICSDEDIVKNAHPNVEYRKSRLCPSEGWADE